LSWEGDPLESRHAGPQVEAAVAGRRVAYRVAQEVYAEDGEPQGVGSGLGGSGGEACAQQSETARNTGAAAPGA